MITLIFFSSQRLTTPTLIVQDEVVKINVFMCEKISAINRSKLKKLKETLTKKPPIFLDTT